MSDNMKCNWNVGVNNLRYETLVILHDSGDYSSVVADGKSLILDTVQDGAVAGEYSGQAIQDVARLVADCLLKSSRLDECLDWIDHCCREQYIMIGDYYARFIRGWVYHNKRLYRDSLELSHELIREMAPGTDLRLYGMVLRLHGMSLSYTGKSRKGRRYVSDAISILRACEDVDQLIVSHCSLAIIEKYTGSLLKSIQSYEEAKSLLAHCRPARRHIQVLNGMAIAYLKSGFCPAADDCIQEAYALRSNSDGDRQQLLLNIIEARIKLACCDYTRATEIAGECLSRSEYAERSREEALALETLGDIATARAQYESARRYYERAKAIGEAIAPEGDLVAENMRRLASLRLHMGEAFEAVPLLKEAIAFSRRCEERYEIGVAQRHLARAYSRLGQFLGAEQAVRESIGTFAAMGAKLELAKSHLEAARVCHAWYQTLADDIDVATSYRNPHPYNHLESAWTHAIEAFHGFADLERPEEQRACEELMETLRSGGHPLWMRHAVSAREAEIRINDKPFIANAPAMKQLITMVEIAASTVEPVLVTGETGTGKELIARLVHDRSERAERPFLPVNCAAIPETLFEREFFGHVRGAYTGAEAEKPGLCETAAGGTLFLDEIGDMPVYLQVKLLRLLQEGTFHRLGDPVERHVDLRIVAATNAPLPTLIAEGRFRQDLYYRLQTLEMVIPPLRERPEDLEELVALFVAKVLGETVDVGKLFDKSVWHVLRNYPWPGNVRELEAMTRRLALLARHGGRATIDMLPEEMRRWKDRKAHAAGALDLSVYVSRAERERISQALLVKAGNRTEAARALGISRNQLYKKMDKLGIKIPV